MPTLTVRNIPKGDYAVPKADGKRNRRSINAEVLAMFADKADTARRPGECDQNYEGAG